MDADIEQHPEHFHPFSNELMDQIDLLIESCDVRFYILGTPDLIIRVGQPVEVNNLKSQSDACRCASGLGHLIMKKLIDGSGCVLQCDYEWCRVSL